jgi:hypothetical protein
MANARALAQIHASRFALPVGAVAGRIDEINCEPRRLNSTGTAFLKSTRRCPIRTPFPVSKVPISIFGVLAWPIQSETLRRSRVARRVVRAQVPQHARRDTLGPERRASRGGRGDVLGEHALEAVA